MEESCSVVFNSATPWPGVTRLLCPGNSAGKNTGVGCHFPLQEIFPTQGLNPGLPHCRQTFYCLSHQGRPDYTIMSLIQTQGTGQDTHSWILPVKLWLRKPWISDPGDLQQPPTVPLKVAFQGPCAENDFSKTYNQNIFILILKSSFL